MHPRLHQLRAAALGGTDRAEDISITLGAAPAVQARVTRYDGPTELVFDDPERAVRFEVPVAALPARPVLDDAIVDQNGQLWRVISIEDRPEVGCWMLTVERS